MIPPQLALLLTLAFVGYLFFRHRGEPRLTTRALWIPLIWLILICSRNVSEWLGFGGGESLTEGSPLDSMIYLSLELAALLVLLGRGTSLSEFLRRNPWFALFFVYGAISILWADFPLVAAKRWSKALSHPLMLLVIVTEPNPRAALTWLMKRAAYVVLPFSMLLIRYYPDLGRTFDMWSGMAANTGVTHSKNALGWDCVLFGFFFAWHFLTTLHAPHTPARRKELYFSGASLLFIGWLLLLSHSATAFAALFVGLSFLLLLERRIVNDSNIRRYLIAGLAVALVIQYFGIAGMLIAALGRDATLTGRTELWEHVLSLDVNPILGTGFETFWLGARLERLTAIYYWAPNQAHNGYLETYLNLGWIGVILLVGWILSGFRHAIRLLRVDVEFARFAIAFLVMCVLYNLTEATFKGLHPMWFMFYLSATDYQRRGSPVTVKPPLTSRAKDSRRWDAWRTSLFPSTPRR